MLNMEEWGDKYLIGIEQLDEHHKHLYDLLRESYDLLVLKNNNDGRIGKVLDSMSDYATYHISTEEDWMHDLKYPKQTEHTQEHLEFVHRVSEFSNNFKNGTEHLTLEIVTFLREWLVNHIMTLDKEFAAFISNEARFCEMTASKYH